MTLRKRFITLTNFFSHRCLSNRGQCHHRPMRRLGVLIAFGAWMAASVAGAADTKPGKGTGKPLSAADEAALARYLNEAFDEGYVMGPKHLQDAERYLTQARRAAPGDPRTDYVHGLVLLKQSQAKTAVAQFEAAIKHEGGSHYWPAWQAAIWGYLVDKQYETGLKKLDEFAAAGSERRKAR